MVEKVFFQSSLPRSGSTLFQNIMAQNPEFYVTPTSGVLELLYGARVNYTDSPEFKAQDHEEMRKGFYGFCRSGLHGFFDAITDRPYVLDKSRGWAIHRGFLNEFYPDPKIVCLVRDPRSILSSMEKKFRANQHKDHKITDHQKLVGITTESRIDVWVSSPPFGLAMERLKQVFKEGINQKMLFIRFEDLVIHPNREIDRVYDYLGLTRYDHDFENIQQTTREDDSIYGIYGDHTIRPKLETPRPDYREILGVDASTWVKNKYSWFYEEFKYF